MADKSRPDGVGKKDETDDILKRVERESDVVGTSALVRTAEKARDHLAGADTDQKDPIELWGTRIGRGLSIIGFIVLAIWLVNFLGRAK